MLLADLLWAWPWPWEAVHLDSLASLAQCLFAEKNTPSAPLLFTRYPRKGLQGMGL